MINFFSKLKDNRIFQFSVVVIIVLNAILIGATTYKLDPLFLNIIHLLDYTITLFFVIEILIRFIGEKEKKNFFKDGWNVFDTVIVAISLIPIPNNSSFLVLRLLRIFRVLRLISVIPELKKIIEALKNKFSEIKEPIKEDICYATTNRQTAVKKIAKDCEMFFVIGSKNSSNSLRLVEVAQQAGCKKSELFHSGSVVPIEKIINCSTIGISSGASAPEVLVKNFIEQIKKEVSIEIEEVEIVKENVIFKTPGRLN